MNSSMSIEHCPLVARHAAPDQFQDGVERFVLPIVAHPSLSSWLVLARGIVHDPGDPLDPLGIDAGLALAAGGAAQLRWAAALGWISDTWSMVSAPALAVASFAMAQAIGGSGIIACFAGGLLVGALLPQHKHERLRGGLGEALSLMTWLVFGSIVASQLLCHANLAFILYAVLSLTVIRMLPVALCLLGARVTISELLFVGWFGPRGFARIVFAIMVFDATLPGNTALMAMVAGRWC